MKGIIFKPDMIQAIIEGRKTNTRRAEAGLKEVNREPDKWILVRRDQMIGIPADTYIFHNKVDRELDGERIAKFIKPRYQVGETVYIKEAFYLDESAELREDGLFYKADEWMKMAVEDAGEKWQSPHFMSEWAARYFLVITGNSAERLSLPLSPEELVLEGGEAALPILEKINGLWVFTYTFRNKEGK